MGKGKRMNMVRRSDRILPTPETLAKLMPDPLLSLDPDYQRAALEIERAYTLLTAPVAERIGDLDRVRATRAEWTDGQAALIERYCEWVDRLNRANAAHQQVGSRPRYRVMLILDMIVDRLSGPKDMLLSALDFWLDNRPHACYAPDNHRNTPAGNHVRAGVVVSGG